MLSNYYYHFYNSMLDSWFWKHMHAHMHAHAQTHTHNTHTGFFYVNDNLDKIYTLKKYLSTYPPGIAR